MATESYKYAGSSVPGAGSGPLILKGSILSAGDDDRVEIGETVDLTDEQVKEFRANGLKLTKSSEASEPDNATAGDSGQPETREQQQSAQRPAAQTPSPGSAAGKSK